ncbi:MAG: diguanylate cyclase [Paracoccaceae bacterium]
MTEDRTGLLVLDANAARRAALRARLTRAGFTVAADGTQAPQRSLARTVPLAAVLGADPADAPALTVASLRAARPDMPVICVCAAPSARFRLGLVDAGCEDVIAPLGQDALLLARLRGILRRLDALSDLATIDDARQGVGYGLREDGPSFATAPMSASQLLRRAGCVVLTRRAREARADLAEALFDAAAPPGPAAEVVVIHAGSRTDRAVRHELAELRTQAATRDAAIVALVPDRRTELQAALLDLGADDVADAQAELPELLTRIARAAQRRRVHRRARARLRDGMEAAVTDPLTGLRNRRFALPCLERIVGAGRPFGLLMADIDHFKAINDRHGHAVGDAVLAQVGLMLRDGLRAMDLAARIGGEEFLVLLPDSDLDGTASVASRLRRRVAETSFRGPHGARVRATLSVGFTTGPRRGEGAEAALARADRALYAAKAQGRDRVVHDAQA